MFFVDLIPKYSGPDHNFDISYCVSHYIKVELCNECIEWAMQEKRTFLRQALEVCDT